MSFDTHSLFAFSNVQTPPSPADSGTSLTVTTGDGTKFHTGQNVTICPANTQPTQANAEICRITAIAGDTLTITRTQEGSSARTILQGDQIANSETPKVFTDIESAINTNTTNIGNLNTGWIASGDTLAYVSANSFKIAGVDRTAVYTKGTRVKFTNNSTTFYGVVISSSFSTDTTVTLAANNDYSIANSAITAPYYSYAASPQGYPGWFNYTPTYSASGSMTFGTVTTTRAMFSITGRVCTIMLNFNGTTGGSASTAIYFTIPVALLNADNNFEPGFGAAAYDAGAIMCQIIGGTSSTVLSAQKYNSSNWGIGSNKQICTSGSYQF